MNSSETEDHVSRLSEFETLHCDLAVIGRGMAGMAAALFAANRGLATVQVGMTGELIFASGFMDLMGIHPTAEKKSWENPWSGIDALVKDIPSHPYARIKKRAIRDAFEEVLIFLNEMDLPYCRRKERNCEVITPLGTVKRTYCAPKTMWNGVRALEEKRPCLLIDFKGLNDFSACQIVTTLHKKWGGLRSKTLLFPGVENERELLFGETLANSLVLSENLDKLTEAIKPHVKDAKAVGMPAILGKERAHDTISKLENQIGVPVFEIPTAPVSIPGLRLRDAFARGLAAKGVRFFPQNRVNEVSKNLPENFVLSFGNNGIKQTLRAKGIILTSGRFLGKGLVADRKGIHETLFNLPVFQPGSRSGWHRKDFLDPRGHPLNRAGIETDDAFRPIDGSGKPVFETLFAAGSILAHQDWMREKCGSGLAIATPYAAVNAFLTGR